MDGVSRTRLRVTERNVPAGKKWLKRISSYTHKKAGGGWPLMILVGRFVEARFVLTRHVDVMVDRTRNGANLCVYSFFTGVEDTGL